MKLYFFEDQKQIQGAIIFMIKEFTKYCRNNKPIILHSLKVGFALMDLNKSKDIVIAGLLHDLIEDSHCNIEKIEKKFGKKIANIVNSLTTDKSIGNYEIRWHKDIERIIKQGQDVMLIKVVDSKDNLPYYILISDKEKLKEVFWKHNLLVQSFSKYLANEKIFRTYEKMVREALNNENL